MALEIPDDDVTTASPVANSGDFGFLSKKSYVPPSWASHLSQVPCHTISFAHLPTPIHRWNIPNLPPGTELWVKRDDLSGMQLSGNKARKLEFLMADAVAQRADCIVTFGPIQSNHCRATTVAAKYLNLDCFLILMTSKDRLDEDYGLVGNLLVMRLLGAHVEVVTTEQFAKFGSAALTNLLKERLIKEGRRPYVVPEGGSNSLGTWGYIEAIREVEQQLHTFTDTRGFDDIVVACGSGSTAIGIALGCWLSNLNAKVHAFSIFYDPVYIYDYGQRLIDELKAGVKARDIMNIQNAIGMGYGINTEEELKFIKDVACTTGVVLDTSYSAKAAFGLINDMAEHIEKWKGRRVLFIHTGGLLGLYDKTSKLAPLVGSWQKMDLGELEPSNDNIGRSF